MPAQHFVPRFATAIQASPRVQANALRALALAPEEHSPTEWAPRAAAALLLGASWEGVDANGAAVARATGVTEEAVAKHYATLAAALKKATQG